MTYVYLDYETRSECDLPSRGAFAYAEHPTTEAICCFIEFSNGGRVLWTPVAYPGWIPPEGVEHHWGIEYLQRLFSDPSLVFIAHNSTFDQAISEYTLKLPRVRWFDSMALADYLSLPGGLDDLAHLLWGTGKDKAGYQLMMSLCKPGRNGAFREITHQVLTDLTVYNVRDVELMRRFIEEYIKFWPACETPVFEVHNRVNMRGLGLDVEAASGLLSIVQQLAGNAGHVVEDVTRHLAINGVSMALAGTDLTRVAHLQKWINTMLEGRGVIDSCDEETLTELLAQPDEVVPQVVKQIVDSRLSVSLASVKKLQSALNRVSADGRVRGNYRFAGAHTHRWTSPGVQIQNLSRPVPWLEEEALDAEKRPQAELMTGLLDACRAQRLDSFLLAVNNVDNYAKSKTGGKTTVAVNDVLRSLIRPMFIPAPGHKLVGADFAQIEGRGAAWMAGDTKALEAFTNNDRDPVNYPDVYCIMAGHIFGESVTKKDKVRRHTGKTAELGCNYGQGAKKFGAMNGPDLERAGVTSETVVSKWRELHAPITKYWAALEAAMRQAITGGRGRTVFPAGPVTYEHCANGEVQLHFPSGRTMRYHKARMAKDERSLYGDRLQITYNNYRKGKGEVRTPTLWGGSQLENACQSLCRDLETNAMVQIEEAGPPIVMHTHDEVMAEVPDAYAQEVAEFIGRTMSTAPPWASGFPVKAEPAILIRYGK